MDSGDLRRTLTAKVQTGQRLTLEEGLALYAEPDLTWLGELANLRRERAFGNRTTYVVNLHLNYTNLCVGSCLFCAFARKPGEPGGYEMTVEEMVERIRPLRGVPGAEVHIVGGLHPGHPYRFYPDLLEALHRAAPGLHLKAFTAVEIEHFSRLAGRSIEWVLQDLKAHGLGSMPGGGAEVLVERVQRKLHPAKTTPERWLEIHGCAHRLGIPTSATMLVGHIEKPAERLEHMDRLRRAQERSGGFLAFIPLRFHPANTRLSGLPLMSDEGMLRDLAISRLMLDNIPHIKAYWVMAGLEVAARAQWFGADDLDGTVVEERITHMAGCLSPAGLAEENLRGMILETGREPVRRDALYRPLEKLPLEVDASCAFSS